MADITENKVRRNPFIGTTISTGKSEFEARMKVLEPNLAKALLAGTVHTVDYALYATRLIGADTTIELMQSADTKKVGITNINNRKLEANTYAFVKGMQLMESTAECATEADVLKAEFGKIGKNTANGELEIKQGDKILFPRSSNAIFNYNGEDKLTGYYAFDCPKVFQPLTDIIPTLYLPAANSTDNNVAANTAIRIVFHCVKTNKA